MKKTKIVRAFILAVLITFLLSSVIGTQLVLMDVKDFGLDVSSSQRLSSTLHDIIGLAPALSILISTAFLVAFAVAALCNRFLGGNRYYRYTLAGFTCLPVTLLLIKYIMGATLFAAARTGYGMFLVSLCGLLGGWVFARLTQPETV